MVRHQAESAAQNAAAPSPPWLLIWGASGRAASWSAVRAGYRPWVIDQFADLDMPASAVVHSSAWKTLPGWPHDWPGELQTTGAKPGCWLLPVGGAENRLTSLTELEQRAETLGTPAAAMTATRDPLQWTRTLQTAGLPFLPLRTAGLSFLPLRAATSLLPNNFTRKRGERWLRKPLLGTGGQRIQLLTEPEQTPDGEHFDQLFRLGVTGSAQFRSRGILDGVLADCSLAAVHAGKSTAATEQLISRKSLSDQWTGAASAQPESKPQTELLGTALQWSGVPELEAQPFAYAGNVFPLAAVYPEGEFERSQQLRLLGNLLADTFGLRGVWGLDFLWTEGLVYPLEINPRYTAALELCELNAGRCLLPVPFAANDTAEARQWTSRDVSETKLVLAKRVLYADREVRIPAEWDWQQERERCGGSRDPQQPWDIPVLTDLPVCGTHFFPGQPVCTIWGAGETWPECLSVLEQRWQTVRSRLQLPSVPVGWPPEGLPEAVCSA